MRDGYKFSHWGVPTQEKKDGMVYVEGIKTWITDFAQNPYAIEWLRFEADSPMHELVQKMPHVAYEVENLNEALADQKVIVPPFPVGENLTCAFIDGGGFSVELMEFKK
ncbi:MAG: hypothetical protein IKE69_00050 [Thermoguttaceae bacterium]|nr:hypothetical protein [Thermoguttaceae bacterium]